MEPDEFGEYHCVDCLRALDYVTTVALVLRTTAWSPRPRLPGEGTF
jgi:hypothetical protein